MTLLVSQARAGARAWVTAEGAAIPGFAGAFLHGSMHALPATATLPATSDVDLVVVLAGAAPPKLGKFRYRGVLLDVSFLPLNEIASPEQVLSQYHLAGSLAAPGVLADPSGHLAALHAEVAREFARRVWVERRCREAENRVMRHLASASAGDPLPDQVTAWLFAAGVSVHILLVAGLRNPTVRRRYLDARELLTRYGHAAFYEELLGQLGCASMTQERAMRHLDTVAAAFDAAARAIATPFFFASDLTPLARPLAIDGSQELIQRGDHREAVFWLVATASRCQKVFHVDAPDLEAVFAPGYRDLLADLGITGAADLERRKERVVAFLPRVLAVARAIVAANPEIVD